MNEKFKVKEVKIAALPYSWIMVRGKSLTKSRRLNLLLESRSIERVSTANLLGRKYTAIDLWRGRIFLEGSRIQSEALARCLALLVVRQSVSFEEIIRVTTDGRDNYSPQIHDPRIHQYLSRLRKTLHLSGDLRSYERQVQLLEWKRPPLLIPHEQFTSLMRGSLSQDLA